MLLSVVIVARNEEENIERCIKSILRETKGISKVEVLMVDSASTDQTVEIAKNYSINIIQLKSDWPLSPSAGRFSGVNNTTGKYVLIIDGDMELLAGWVNKALEFLDGNSKCAAVMGKSYNIYRNQEKPSLDRYAKRIGRTKKINYVQQSSFFRRICLEEVGNFHPFLRAEEEAEISCRLRNKGYNLYFLDYESAYHYRPHTDPFREMRRRKTTGLYPGMGDMFSWCLRKGYYTILWERFKVFFFFGMFAGCSVFGFLILLLLGQVIPAVVFLMLPVYFFVFQCVKKGSVRQGVLSWLNVSMIALSLLKGLFRKIPEISEYPKDVMWVKRIQGIKPY